MLELGSVKKTRNIVGWNIHWDAAKSFKYPLEQPYTKPTTVRRTGSSQEQNRLSYTATSGTLLSPSRGKYPEIRLKRDTGAFEGSEIAALMAEKRLWKDPVVDQLRATK